MIAAVVVAAAFFGLRTTTVELLPFRYVVAPLSLSLSTSPGLAFSLSRWRPLPGCCWSAAFLLLLLLFLVRRSLSLSLSLWCNSLNRSTERERERERRGCPGHPSLANGPVISRSVLCYCRCCCCCCGYCCCCCCWCCCCRVFHGLPCRASRPFV